jgi:ubiquinone biosynthesis protein COQ9
MSDPGNSETHRLRERILLAALAHVPFDGWSKASLAKGAADAGLDIDAARLAFPGGVPELVDYFSTYTDEKMNAVLAAENLETMKIRDRIGTALRVRLELLARHREAVRHLLAYFALPQNAPLGIKCLARTVDAIWRAAGDTATDFSFYTKRTTLAGVYTTTLLFWLDDDSDGFHDTFAFLDRRIDDVMELHKAREKLSRGFGDLAGRLAGLFGGTPPRP